MMPISIFADIIFIILSFSALMLLFSLGRFLLYFWNKPLAIDIPHSAIAEAFWTGLRFDAKISCILLVPLAFALLLPSGLAWRNWWVAYLIVMASFSSLWLTVEAEFYREFHTRLNSIVIQYLTEDIKTVISMVLTGGPALAFITGLVFFITLNIIDFTLASSLSYPSASLDLSYWWRIPIFLVVASGIALGIRGTLRSGPPLRWGDAFTTEHLFSNHLGLNGLYTLYQAWKGWGKNDSAKIWKYFMPRDQALKITRELVLQPCDKLLAPAASPMLRKTTPQGPTIKGVENVVFILMESFTSRFVGAQGAPGQITPYFDQLCQQGTLCTQMFSVGTHTHQGMFGSFASFPNLPDYEYLMQQSAGSGQFSGLPAMIRSIGYTNNVFVYNGHFSWDNQQGFFGAQGMSKFIGRDEYIDPVFTDRTWGVSDQDMFDRAVDELDELHQQQEPFYGLLQTLSNHMPYALPKDLPVDSVTEFDRLNKHLTAMRYSDWALGQFFEKAKAKPWYEKTLFVVLADHGFSMPGQISSIDLQRFHIPGLFIAPGIQDILGNTFDKTCSQLDLASTALSLLGKPFTQAGWGRNIFNLKPDDPGYAIMKPSGSDKTVAMVQGNEVIVKGSGIEPECYRIDLSFPPSDQRLSSDASKDKRYQQLAAFLQTAVISLEERTTGHEITDQQFSTKAVPANDF